MNQSGSFKKGRFYLVVDEGVRHSFHSQMRAAFQDWCCLAPHKATRGLCQEDLIWTKNEAGLGELSKIRNKKLRHKSKPGWGVARRPGAAAGNSAFHLASPVMAAILCLAPQGPVSPLVSTILASMEGLAEAVSERETGVRKSCEKALSEGSREGVATDLIPLFCLMLHVLVSKSVLGRSKDPLLPESAHPSQGRNMCLVHNEASGGGITLNKS